MASTLPEDRPRKDLEIGGIITDEQLGIYVPLYETQVEAADQYFQPLYSSLLEADKTRHGLNRLLSNVGEPQIPPLELDRQVSGGLFMLVSNAFAYDSFLLDPQNNVAEYSGHGTHRPGDKLFFSDFKLKVSEQNAQTVEMEITEYPDLKPMEALYLARFRTPSRYIRYNKLIFDPQQHVIGFLEYQPDVIRRY